MVAAQFEEREYESAALVELAADGGAIFTPGQVLEKLLGYDVAAAPAPHHPLWQVLRVPRPPGVVLLPNIWPQGGRPPGDRLPHSPVSVILQFKRPEFLHGSRAAQWRLWGEPYYRIERRTEQHALLLRLERRMAGEAIVRYGAPAFWRTNELEAAHLDRAVLRRTSYVPPSLFGRHTVWTYVGPGEGRFNPAGRRIDVESFDDLASGWAFDPPSGNLPVLVRGGLQLHLSRLSAAAGHRSSPRFRRLIDLWIGAVGDRGLGLPVETMQALHDLALVGTALRRAGALWFLGVRH